MSGKIMFMTLRNEIKVSIQQLFYACIYCIAFCFQSWNCKMLQLSAVRKIPIEDSKCCSFQVKANVTATQSLGMTDKKMSTTLVKVKLFVSRTLWCIFTQLWTKICSNTFVISHCDFKIENETACWKPSLQCGLKL